MKRFLIILLIPALALGDGVIKQPTTFTSAAPITLSTGGSFTLETGVTFDGGANVLHGAATPSISTDVANKAYVDAQVGGTGLPAGSDTQVQFNDGGVFGGDADLTWNKTSNVLKNLGTLELGAATDTTVARSSAGHISVEGSVVGLASDTLSFFTASTSNTIGVGNVELGHATDTTLSRNAAGVLQVESVVVPTISSTNILTNKQIVPISNATTSTTSWTPDFDTNNLEVQTALAGALTVNAPTYASAHNGDRRAIRIKDNGTARAITWNAIYRAGTSISLPTTTTISKTLYVGFFYNSTDTKWDLMAYTDGY